MDTPVRGLRWQFSAVRAGGPVNWPWWNYPAHALGLMSDPGDGSRWLTRIPWAVSLSALCVILLVVWSVWPRRFQAVSRQPGSVRWRALGPVCVLGATMVAGFLVFRYVSTSPWPDPPGGAIHYVGQTYRQYKLSQWSSLTFLAVAVPVVVALARSGGWRGRAAGVAVLALWCASGPGGALLLHDVPRLHDPDNDRTARPSVQWLRGDPRRAGQRPADRPDLHRHAAPAADKHQELLAYYLMDRRVSADWHTDDYFGPYLPQDQPLPDGDHCDWRVFYDPPDGRAPDEPHPPGCLVLHATSPRTYPLVGVDGPYPKEINGPDWWYWTNGRLRFRFERKGPRPRFVRLRFSYAPAPEHCILNVRVHGQQGQELKAYDFPMEMGRHKAVLSPIDLSDDAFDVEISCAQEPLHGPPGDARDFLFSVGNFTVETAETPLPDGPGGG